MNRGEIWLAEVGRKTRPVLVVTRPEVIDVRQLVTVVEVTTSVRRLAAEVAFDHDDAGLDRPSVINCDGVHTVAQASLTAHVGSVGDDTMDRVCAAISSATPLAADALGTACSAVSQRGRDRPPPVAHWGALSHPWRLNAPDG